MKLRRVQNGLDVGDILSGQFADLGAGRRPSKCPHADTQNGVKNQNVSPEFRLRNKFAPAQFSRIIHAPFCPLKAEF
jgi:hypothetical protein